MTIPLPLSQSLFLAGSVPLARAWKANRGTTLRHALAWSWLAWLAWAGTAAADLLTSPEIADICRYVALSFIACAGVAVLGARRPGVVAWNFVVAGLLAVMLLPLAEGLVTGGPLHLAGPRLVFLAGTLAVIALNYLPTRLGPAAVCLALGCTLQVLLLAGPDGLSEQLRRSASAVSLPLLAVPWLAWHGLSRQPPALSVFDAVWLNFRDRFGVLWSQRMREQFNRSAANAGWPVTLHWNGLRLNPLASLPEPERQEEMAAVLSALLKRFVMDPSLPQ